MRNLLSAIDPERVEAKALEVEGVSDCTDPSDEACERAQKILIDEAAVVFNGETIEMIDGIRRNREQTIDHDGLDKLTVVGWDEDINENAEQISQDFKDYLESNKDGN